MLSAGRRGLPLSWSLGYLAGSQYKKIEKYANYIGIGLLLAIAAFIGYRVLRSRHRASTT